MLSLDSTHLMAMAIYTSIAVIHSICHLARHLHLVIS